MGDPDSFDMEQVALLDADSIPNENQSLTCFACGEGMTGVFCYACGNKNDNYRRSIWSLGVELFASLTAFEGRIWRSLRSLIFKPGEMAREFADGARTKWTSPIRMYLAMSLILFGYVAISQTQLVAFGTQKDPSSAFQASGGDVNFTPKIFFLERKSKLRELVSDDDILALESEFENIVQDDDKKTVEELTDELNGLEPSLANLEKQIANPPSSYALPGLNAGRKAVISRMNAIEAELNRRKIPEARTDAGTKSDTPPSDGSALEKAPEKMSAEDITTGVRDGLDESDANDAAEAGEITPTNDGPDEEEESRNFNIVDGTGNEFTLDAAGIREAGAIALRYPERVNAPVNKWLPRIMFVMMPFSMLIGAIFIRGRETAMLYDHLVHAAYIHAFSFLLLFVFILFVQYTPIPGLLLIYMLILLIYLPLSAKRMFRRGWFKTIITSYGVGLFYTFIMSLILSTLIIMGVIDIAKEVAEARAANA